ncbi:uncharacterized protein LOC105441383 [Strongylocentrotus purpuratus]|uniref:NACHT domain-containing protein n=1 Tax=Strongylocentrotus purpuratus TaxID=7668 RepID=A0A7M7NYB6_STRPU|nr:uncharacterized protein LOC105441383 [Strongylocentrotus purpuratus]
MPVALSEWRVRIGTFVHWIREYEVQERRERLLKERIRRLKVLCERLKAKRDDSGEGLQNDKSRQNGPNPKGCPHQIANIQSSGNSSDIKDLLTSCDQCIQDLLTASDSHIKEILTPSETCIKHLLTPTDSNIRHLLSLTNSCRKDQHTASDSHVEDLTMFTSNYSHIRELIIHSDSCFRELHMSADAGKDDMLSDSDVKDLLTPRDSAIIEILQPKDYCTCESLTLRNSSIQELLTPTDSYIRELLSVNSHVQEMLTPRDSCKSESLTTGDSYTNVLLTIQDSYTQELLIPRDSYTCESLSPRDSCIQESSVNSHTDLSLSAGDGYIQEMITPRDSYTSESLTTGDSDIHELFTPRDSYIQELLTQRDSYTYESLTPGDSYTNELVLPGHSYTNKSLRPMDSYIQNLIAPRDSSIRALLTTDSCTSGILTPIDSNTKITLTPEDSYVQEVLTSRDSYTIEPLTQRDSYIQELLKPGHSFTNTSLTPGESYIQELLAPRDSYTNESLTPGHSFTNTFLTPGDSYIQELLAPRDSYTNKLLTPTDSYTNEPHTPGDLYIQELLKPSDSFTNTSLTPGESYIQEILAPRESYTKKLLTPTDFYANEPLTPEDSYIQELITPQDSYTNELLTPGHFCINTSLTPGDSYIQELLAPRNCYTNNILMPTDSYANEPLPPEDSYTQDFLTPTSRCSDIRELLTPRDLSTNESLTQGDSYIQELLTPRDSYTNESLTPGHSFTNTSLTPGDSYIQELLAPRDSYTTESLTPGDSYTQDFLTPRDFYTNESLTPGHSSTNTSLTPGDSYIQELLAPRDCYTNNILMPTDSYANEPLTSEDSYTQDFLTPTCRCSDIRELLTPRDLSTNESLTQGDSYIQELLTPRDSYTNESLTPGHSFTNTSLTPRDSYIHKLLAPRDSYTKEALTPGDSYTQDLLTSRYSDIRELLTTGDSSTNESLTRGDSYIQDFLTPRESYIRELLTPRDLNTNESLTPGDSYIQELLTPINSYTNEPLTGHSYTNKPFTGVELESPRQGDNKTSPTSSLDSDAVQHGPFGGKEMANTSSRSSCHKTDSSKGTVDVMLSQQPYLTELLLVKAGDVELNPGPLHGSIDSALQESELVLLAEEVPVNCYNKLCIGLGISFSQSQDVLTQHHLNFPGALIQIFYRWKVRQRDGTNCRALLGEILQNADMVVLQTKLLKGEYLTSGTPTSSIDSALQESELVLLAEEVPVDCYNKLCIGLGISLSQSQDVLTQHHLNFPGALIHFFCRWKVSQRDGTNCEYLTSGTPTSSIDSALQESELVLLAEEVPIYCYNKLCIGLGEYLTSGTPTSSIDSALQESELVLLAEEVPVDCYYKLCSGLGFSSSQSQNVLTQHHLNLSGALIELFCRWKGKQRDGTNCRALLGEILQNADMVVLQTKLLKGEYLTSGTPTSLIDSVLQDSELILLAEVVPGDCYYKVCSGLGFSSSQSQNVLTQHHSNLPGALIELFCRWKGKQRDGTNCRALLGEILQNADMGALQTKLLKGEYLTSGTPTSLIDSVLQESELKLLAEEVPVDCYYILCIGLGISLSQSRNVLTQHRFNFPHALIEFFYGWKVRQRDGANCRALLGEILKNADMGALQTKLMKGEYLTSGTPTSLIYSVLQESELKLLAEEVPVGCYNKLCIGLGFSLSQSQTVLTQHHFNFPGALIQMFCRWKVRQRDGTNCRALLGEILQNADMGALQTKLLKGEYLTSGTSSFDPILDTSQPFMTEAQVLQCGEDLKIFYREQMCKIKPDPLESNIIFDFEQIYTNLTLLRKEMGIMRTERPERPLDYTDLLTTKINGVLPKRLLVEGEGGVGKTTFCSKIAWDWFNGSPEFQRFSWVLVIPLCNIVKGQTIGDIMKNYLSDNNAVNPKQIDSYILSQPTKVLIVLDGLDKYDGDLSAEENSDISQILRFDKFKQCIVLVTTRPWGADKIKSNERLLRSYAFIVIKGFSTENVSTYISKYFVDDEKAGSELIRFIEVNDVIKENMAPFPIYLTMLCILWKNCDSEKQETIRRLKTFSQLFEQMIMFLRDHDISKVFDLDKEMENTKLCLQRIGSIAFSGILEKKLVFSEEDFSSCKEAMETCCRMGVLSRENQNVSRWQRTLNPSPRIITGVFFPHKLFQEYVASVYLASLYDTNREEYSRSMGKVLSKDPQEFRYLLYFTAALGKEVGLDIVEKIQQNDFANVQQRKRNNDFLADVAFEAYNKDVAKVVGQQIFADGRILTIDKDMPAHTFSGYLFIMEQHGMETLVFRDRSCGQTVSRDLANVLFESKSLSRLVFYHTTLDDDFYQLMHKRVPTKTVGKSSIKELVVDHQFLSGLQMYNNGDINVTVEDLFPSLKQLTFTTLHTVSPGVVKQLAHSSLEVLFIEHGEEGSKLVPLIGEPASLGQLFSTSFPQLTCLTFRELVMGNIRSEAILRNLKNHLHLKSISIISCFTDDELDPLAEQITTENRMKLTLQHDKRKWKRRPGRTSDIMV